MTTVDENMIILGFYLMVFIGLLGLGCGIQMLLESYQEEKMAKRRKLVRSAYF